jgi:hypothetical protein
VGDKQNRRALLFAHTLQQLKNAIGAFAEVAPQI